MNAVETLTILFTDVVGSTALRSELGDDRVDALLRIHDDACRAALVAHNGREVKHTGDGLMAVFEASSDAVACGVAMHKAVTRATTRAGVPLALRVGISAGDVTRVDDDCFGTPVNEAARLGAAAAPGEILVTEIVRLLAGSRGAFEFANAPSRELKGLGTVATWSVEWTPEPLGAPLPAALASLPRTPFVGRDDQTARFETLWQETLAGRRQVMLVAGEPGVGKTRFAAERAWSVHSGGATVLLGRSEDGVAAPYRAFAEALRPLIDAEGDDLGAWAAAHGAYVGPLFSGVTERFAGVGAPVATDPETEQLRLFEAVVALLATVAARVPVLLVLDDLHWADRPSLLLLRHVIRSDAVTRLFVLGTYRETDLDRNHPLSGLLADLRADERTIRVLLRGLDEAATVELVEAWADHPVDVAFVQAVHRETEGNPFFVHQVLTHLAETGALKQTEGGWVLDRPIERLGIPEGVREVVGRRLTRLGDPTNRLLGVASVIGREFGLDLLVAVGGVAEDDALDALEPAITARLVEEVPGAPGRFAFTHALVRSTLADELLSLRRVRLHQRIGEAIEALPGADIDRLAELAYHFTEAAPAGDVTKAVRYTIQLADSLGASGEFATAQAGFERALQLLDAAGDSDPELRFDAIEGLARTLSNGPEPRDALAPARAALAIARDLGSMKHVARAVRFLNAIVVFGEQAAEQRDTIDELLAMLPADDLGNRARLLAVRSTLALPSRLSVAEQQQAESDARDSVRFATQADDAEAISIANLALSNLVLGDARVEDALNAAEAIVRAARDTGDTRMQAVGQLRTAQTQLRLGDRRATNAALATAAQLPITRHPSNVSSRLLAVLRATIAMLEGRFDDSAAIADEAARHSTHPGWAWMHFVQHQAIRDHEGRLDADVLDRVATRWPDYPALRSGAALAYAESGDLDAARARYERLAHDDFAALSYGQGRPLTLRQLVDLCAHLGDVPRASVLCSFVVPYDGQLLVPYGGTSCEGAAARVVAQLETILGRYDDAEAHFESALALEQAYGGRALVPRTRYWYARMLQARDARGDHERAAEMLDATLSETRQLGMRLLHRLATAAREHT